MKFDHIVLDLENKVRLSDYVHIAFPHLISKKAGQKCLKKGNIYLNSLIGNSYDWVENNATITLNEPVVIPPKSNIKFDVVYEDEYMAIIDKPAGINVSGNRKAISHFLNVNLQPSNAFDVLPRFTAVHRLDRDTKGLLIIAKSKRSQLNLQSQFESRTIQKIYHAIVIGHPLEPTGTIDNEINGKPATTKYKVLYQTDSCLFGALSYLELNILTGRKHQIRIHLSSKGLPILGDKLYNNHKPIGIGKGMFLFADQVTLNHPISGDKLSFSIPAPPKVKRVLNYYGIVQENNGFID